MNREHLTESASVVNVLDETTVAEDESKKKVGRVVSGRVISHCEIKQHRDVHRFEKISNIIKQFKLSCSKLAASFQSMEVRNSHFAAFIDVFTPNTYVMVVMSAPGIPSAATLINIKNARKHFEKLERVDGGHPSITAGH